MGRYLLAFSYDGGSFHGYQIQPNATTVQSVLQDKLSLLLGETLEIVGSSRTDTGVHAHQQFAHFDLPDGKKVKENSQSYTVGTLARLSVEKDLPILIKAFKILQSKDFGKKYILSIFGEGEMRDQIESLIKNLGLEKNVQLMGRTMNPAEELSKFDLFVLPSKFEGFGLVLLEAMAFNIPIIASDISTAKEVLGEDGAGVFFEQGNENDLADKILNIKTHLDSSFIEKQKIRLNFFNDTVMEQRVRQAYEL
jgi:glycosyltransferase involved in cell wall biosynthesis